MELEDTSAIAIREDEPVAMDTRPIEAQPEVKKGPKWQIKTDALTRPVSSGRASALSGNISQTIAAINKNNFHANNKWSANVDNMASARQSVESSRSKMTSQTNYTDKVDSVMGSNASITTTNGTRRPLGETTRTNTNRHTVADVDKLINGSAGADQENKRQSFPPVAVRRQSLVNMNAAQQPRPKSPTGSIASTATGAPRARRQSGTNIANRLSWLQELESKKTPGQEYMMNKLQGGVADKLRRFESQNSEAGGSASRSQSATRSVSATRGGSDAYGIEAKRLSRTVTHDENFRKKLEEQFQRKQKEDEEREQKKKNRASLQSTASKTPQQIIDYVELNDKDREAEINDLMKDGQGAVNARKLDTQAKAAFANPRQPGAVFQGASAALRSTTNLLDTLNAPQSGGSKQTPSLGRTMSVQQKTRKVSPSARKPPRPVSYAPPAPPMDDEYDPFNYAVYPSRSSIYSYPPEVPVMTPEVEIAEKEAMAPAEDSSESVEVESAAEQKEAPAPEDAVCEPLKATPEPRAREVDAEPTEPIQDAPKELSTPVAPAPTSGWAARFNSTPATALPLRIHGGANKPAAVKESANAAITSAPRESMDEAESTDISRAVSSEELVAQEAVPASPTIVDIPSRPSSKRTTPVKERFVPQEVSHEFNAAALPRMSS